MDIVPFVGRSILRAATSGSFQNPSPVAALGRAAVGYVAEQAGAAAGRAAANVANAAVGYGKRKAEQVAEYFGPESQGTIEKRRKLFTQLGNQHLSIGSASANQSMSGGTASANHSAGNSSSRRYGPAGKSKYMISSAPRMKANYGPRRQIYGAHRPEKKTVDTTNFNLNMDNNSAVALRMQLLNTIPTGNSTITRVGKRVMLKAVHIRGILVGGTATTYDKGSVLLVYIRTPNQAGTLPTMAEILAGAQDSISLTNRDNATRFKIVRRWDYVFSGNATTPNTDQVVYDVDHYVPLKNLPSVWTAGSVAGTIAEFVEGALILITVGYRANGATITPIIAASSRLYFEDD